MTAPLSTRSINDYLGMQALAAQFRYPSRLYQPDIALYNDADVFEMIYRDADIAATLDQYCHEVAATGYQILPGGKTPADEMFAQIVQEGMEKANVAEMVYELSGYAIFGRAYQYPNGARRFQALGGTAPQSWWMPTYFKDIDPRHIIFVPVRWKDPVTGKDRVSTKAQYFDVATAQYEDIKPAFAQNLIELKWGDDEFRLGYGRGLIGAVYFYWRAKTVAMTEGLKGLETWARGIIVGKLNPDREASPDKSNDALADDLLTKLQNMRSRHVVVIPEGTAEIDVKEGGGQGHQIVSWFINYFDSKIARLVLGSVMPSGGGDDSTGTQAKAVVQERTTTRRILFHRRRIEECINRTLMQTIYRLNFPQLVALGIGAAKPPRFCIADEQHSDPKAVADMVKAAQDCGAEIPKKWFHERTGIPVPREGEEVLSAPVKADPFGGGGFGGGGEPPPFGGKPSESGSKPQEREAPEPVRDSA